MQFYVMRKNISTYDYPGCATSWNEVCPDRKWMHEGASCVQNYVVWKHQKTHEKVKMNEHKSGHECTKSRHEPS